MPDTGRHLRLAPPPPRVEVRVRARGDGWEVQAGDGMLHRFASLEAALRCAHELARRAWVDDGCLSCVKIFLHDTWTAIAVFGVHPTPPRPRWTPANVR